MNSRFSLIYQTTLASHILFVLLLIICFGVNIPIVKGQFSTLVSGKVSSGASQQIQFEYQYQYLTHQPIVHRVKTNAKGEFETDIPINVSSWVNWRCQKQRGVMYLHVGDSLHINFDVNSETVAFSGLGAIENNFVQQWMNAYGENSENALYPNAFQNLSAQDFKTLLAKYKKNQLKLLKDATSKRPLSDDFISSMEEQITYSWANSLLEYPVVHGVLNKKPPEFLDQSYYSFLSELDIHNPSALNHPTYIRFLQNYLAYMYSQAHRENSLQAYSAFYYPFLWNVTKEKFKGSVQAYTQAIVIVQIWEDGNEDFAKALYKEYLENHASERPTFALKEMMKKRN